MTDAAPVGFIGLGAMGLPMAERLRAADHPLVVPRHSARTDVAIARLGAEAVESPADVARRCRVLITMLPDTPDVRAVAAGPDGIFAGASAGLLWIDMSTIAPDASRELAATARKLGIRPLDAPVSGGTRGATDGTLSVMVGGEPEDLAGAGEILSALAGRVVLIGPSGAGQVAKAVNQMIVGGTIALVAEGLTVAEAAGCDAAVVREALLGGFADSRVLAVHGERMIKREFEPGFRARLHRKDLSIALATARSGDVAVPVASLVHELFTVLCAHGGGDLDHAALITTVEALRGKAPPPHAA